MGKRQIRYAESRFVFHAVRSVLLDSYGTLYNNVDTAILLYKVGGDMIPTQMMKGILEGCVLAVLCREEHYGYEISQQLECFGFGKIPEGTVYPLLLRLEKRGAIKAFFRESREGPRRKYYSLTPEGHAEYREFIRNYQALRAAVDLLTESTEGDHHEEKDETVS